MATKSEKPWAPPTSDQEFVFENIDSAPEWVDRNWAGYDHGPALAVPHGDILNTTAPYTTDFAHPGDTVKFVAATGSKAAHFEIIPGEPAKVGDITKRPAQESGVALEDALKTGNISPDDLGSDAKAQVAARTPSLQTLVEEGTGAPDKPESTTT